MKITTIKNRRDFLAARNGATCSTESFLLVKNQRSADHPAKKEEARVGFTVTKKMGNAPARNRIKRRLRAAVGKFVVLAEPGCDYIFIARSKALTVEFAKLLRDMEFAFSRIHAKKDRS